MHQLPIQIIINDGLFVKDPESTDLGKKIISKSIELIEELGFEAFTFKKLGQAIGSPESSVYRYFESKHQLLVYLICWYWSWVEYKLVFGTVNQQSSHEKLKIYLSRSLLMIIFRVVLWDRSDYQTMRYRCEQVHKCNLTV